MKVNQHRQTILANNMANANTAGFKHDLAVVTQRRVERDVAPDGFRFAHSVLDGLPGGLNVRPTYQNFAPGRLEQTGRPLDVAIEGDGFFAVTDGTVTRYTRDGQFAINGAGELVLSAGGGRWRVLDDEGSLITVNEVGGPVSVSDHGTILQGAAVVAKIGLSTVDDKQALRKVGGNLFDAGDTAMTAVEGRFRSGAWETSNFDVMDGLVTMIEASRAYELNSSLLKLQDQITGQAINTVGRAR
jgi:flagellar basal-body rod protein FlgF